MGRIASSFALVLALLTLAAPARAARPASGNWTGTVARSTATVSFRVDRSRTHILRLVARVFPVFCYSTGDTSFDTWDIPSMRIRRDGRFDTTYQPRQSKFIARGRFTSTGQLKGYLEERAAGCVGGLPWRAHHRR